MVHIHSFVKALKISWLKLIYMQAESKCWFNLSEIVFPKVVSLGGAFARARACVCVCVCVSILITTFPLSTNMCA